MKRTLLIFILTCACFVTQAQVNIITTIAGTGTAGYNGDDIPATSAQLNWPDALELDKHGNLFVVDPDNVRIRKISLTTGLITTIGGYGTPGSLGDGGQATLAQFNAPQGICIDNDDNIYIGDGLNHKIRKISTTGIVTTVVGSGIGGWGGDGGPAIDAKLNQPVGVYVYNSYLYIADYGNNRVRKVDLATGTIVTVVGGSSMVGYSGNGGLAINAKLNGPIDVVCDNNGNLYIADQKNGAIRKVDAITGIITTVAGIGILGYSGNGGPATNALLNEPHGLSFDKDGNLYIADYRNGAIRKVDAGTNIITTVAGGVVGYGGDGGPATDAKLKSVDVCIDTYGNIYLADYPNDRIRKVNNAVAVNGVNKEIEGKLYPNPTRGTFTIQAPIGISIVNIYNIAGLRVYERTCTTTETEIDITSLPSGVYMVYVQCGDKQYVSKVVKE